MQNWDDLRYLLALEENGNLIKAAKQLRTNPTTVSRHIKRLSETYKRTLVTRQPNGEWILTKDGMLFATAAKRCDVEIGMLNGCAEDTPTEVTITTTEFVGENILAPRLGDLMENDNDLVLTLDMQDRNVSLAYGEADLAIRLGRPTTGKLVASKLADIEMNVFSVGGRRTTRWVGLPAEYDWVPEMQMAREFFGCEPMMRLGNYSSIRKAAVANDLACVGPNLMMSGFLGLHAMSNEHNPASREVWSVFHESRLHDIALSRAREWAKQCFLHQQARPNDHPFQNALFFSATHLSV